MFDYSIVLLPRTDYWSWVDAARDYAAKFGSGLTADPVEAAGYMAPLQTVTIAGLGDGYTAQGDIQRWFRTRYPSVRLDYVACQSPDEFRAALQARLSVGDRYLRPGGLRLHWPTDFAIVNQGFGVHPEIYRRWDLPGSDGLDIFAPLGSKVYAAADGQVSVVEKFKGDPAAMPDGNAVLVKHAGGYATRYAYLDKVLVAIGQAVRAGQPIGLAGASGRTGLSQLRLVLTQAGATAAKRTHYPHDIIDPTPYLDWPAPMTAPADVASYQWTPGYCLVGLHGRANGPEQAADFPLTGQARLEAVKLLSSAQASDVDTLRGI